MNAEFLGCKFRLYTRLLRARVFQTIKEKQTYLSEFKTLRSECHNEMNRVLNNMNLLLWRLFYGSELRGNDRQALVKNMVGILRVEEARMIIAYDNVDKALSECGEYVDASSRDAPSRQKIRTCAPFFTRH